MIRESISCLYIIILILTLLGTGCNVKKIAPNRTEITDTVLIAKIQDAVDKAIPIDRIEEFVGKSANINTYLRDEDKFYLNHSAIGPDLELNKKIPNLSEALYVILWVRPILSISPKIVGLVWNGENRLHIFYGILHPQQGG
ncbi:MAG: hypothetical protein ACMUIP_17215 [bacterium]